MTTVNSRMKGLKVVGRGSSRGQEQQFPIGFKILVVVTTPKCQGILFQRERSLYILFAF